MTEKEAAGLAKDFLIKDIGLELCTSLPSGAYNVNLDNEFIFAVHDRRELKIGDSPYISVSKTTSQVRYLGVLGE
jgi:hypothetical protein